MERAIPNIMINKIFFDLDETLVYVSWAVELGQTHKTFLLDELEYNCIARPCAQRLIEFARMLVGEKNVFILTTATLEYAREVNRIEEFGFDDDHILAREELEKHEYATAYGGFATLPSVHAHPDNVLIDNLPPRTNWNKVSFLGIGPNYQTNYWKVNDYLGVNRIIDEFEKNIRLFLEDRIKLDSAPELA